MARCGYSQTKFLPIFFTYENVYKNEMLEEVDGLFCSKLTIVRIINRHELIKLAQIKPLKLLF